MSELTLFLTSLLLIKFLNFNNKTGQQTYKTGQHTYNTGQHTYNKIGQHTYNKTGQHTYNKTGQHIYNKNRLCMLKVEYIHIAPSNFPSNLKLDSSF